jgi:hypothetical protein
VVLDIVPRGTGPSCARSRHYDMRYENRQVSAVQQHAINEVCRVIAANDR